MLILSFSLFLFIFLSVISASSDEFNTPKRNRSRQCSSRREVPRRGWCQCPQKCQSTMLGATVRPLCFSFYDQPLITCKFPFRGTCLSLNNELLPYCYSYPACAFPNESMEMTTDIKSGTVTIIDSRDQSFWRAVIEAPVGSQIIADSYCEEGFTARCVHQTPLL